MPDIDFQRIVLNLIPKKGDEPVVFYASQYETTRPFIADLMWGETEFEPGDDCWVEIDIRKNDDNLVVITDDVAIDNNEVSVILPVQALTCIGKNLGQVKIYAGVDQLIAALNFILEVQPDPLAGGVTSETAIDNLTEQIEEITQQVIDDDYYNKTEVDDLLDLKADKATTYTKTQVDNALALKANSADLATVATTGDYDDLINRPTIPAAQVQSDYTQADNTQVDYIKNKPDISAMINNALFDIMPIATEGPAAICSFDTELAVQLQSVIVDVVASQASGTPTPSSPIPINGYTEANITRCGVNLFDIEKFLTDNNVPFTKDADGWYSFTTKSEIYNNHYKLPVSTSKSLLLLLDTDGTTVTSFRARVYDSSDNYIVQTAADNPPTATIANKDIGYIGFNWSGANGTAKIKLIVIDGATAPTTYHAYNGNTYTIAFGQTVYGGVLDVTTGVLTVTHANIASYNGESINEPWLSSKDVYTPGGTPTTGAQVVYPLTTPFDIDLTPVQINAIVGTNNVYSDTGDTTVSYKDSIQHYIDSRI